MSELPMTLAMLANKLGISRSNLHKRVRREGVKTIKVPCLTGGGLQLLTAVPAEYAERLIRQYEEAKANELLGAGGREAGQER